MDPFELLKTDHRKVEQLFSQLESASGKRKLEAFKQIKTELELHIQSEEKIFSKEALKLAVNLLFKERGLVNG